MAWKTWHYFMLGSLLQGICDIIQGAAVTFWSSELPLLAGNGHSLMVEDNSDEIADEIARWITAL